MSQTYSYRGYEIQLKETGENCVALFQTSPLERMVMVSATVSEGMDILQARVRLLIDFEFDRQKTSQ